jgi:NAD+ synthase (glutamine-hydrolysing)
MTNSTEGLKIRCEQLNPIVGDVSANTDAIIQVYHQALNDGIHLLVLPELVVCGYPPMDLLERKPFINDILAAVERIVQHTKDTAIIFGTPLRNPSGMGRPLVNAAILAQHGNILASRYKTLLPTYDIFDELRYFEPATENKPISWMGIELGLTICEDIWNIENERVYHVYDRDPSSELKNLGAEIIINISASPFTHTKAESRRKMLHRHAAELGIPFVYANQCGANTDIIFDGDSMFVNPGGDIVGVAPMFDEGYIDATFKSGRLSIGQIHSAGLPTKDERTFRAIVRGIRDYYAKLKLDRKAVIGLSGGIDSAVVAVLAVEALGADRVVGITMPSMFSSEGSVSDSDQLAQNLGITIHKLPISGIYQAYIGELTPVFGDDDFGLAHENLQSRIRGSLIMAYSNKFGHLMLNTGNKSELAVGYCTLYGDMNGALAPISDLYKTEVYSLAHWLNEKYFMKEMIPRNTLLKEPSAELAPGQFDADSLPPYDILDPILKRYIEEAQSTSEIRQAGFDPATIDKVLRLLSQSEFKRKQSPPGLRLSSKAFGLGRRIPIVQGWKEQ